MQDKFIVKNELVADKVPSSFSTNTLNVAAFSSSFSILNIEDVVASSNAFEIGKLNGELIEQHVYIVIGLVLHDMQVVPHPKNALSQVSKHASPQSAFC